MAIEVVGSSPASADRPERPRLGLRRHFTTPGTHPYDEVPWERRTASIASEGGQSVFEQEGVEVPKPWSQLATNVVASKYFRGALGAPEREWSVRQLIDRVVTTLRTWGVEEGYLADATEADTFEAELTHLLVTQKAAFNSPVWFNVGMRADPQCSACQPYAALVSTPDGMVPIGRIVEEEQVGREVYDAHGVTRVVAVTANGRKPVWRVTLRNGSFVEATPDHVVKAVDERRTAPRWLRVDELRVGMRMHLHPHRAKVRHQALAGVGAGGPWAGDELDVGTADERAVAEAALAGWLQSDGFVGQYDHGTNRSLTLELLVAGDDEHAWVSDALDIVFPDVHRHERRVETADPDLDLRRIRLYGEALRSFVEEWGLLARGDDLRVPARMWEASVPEVVAYLGSVFQAEGDVTVSRGNGQESARVALAVASERWTEDLQVLLGVLGIYSRRVRKRDAREDRRDTWELSIGIGSERARFAEQIGFLSGDKQRRLVESLRVEGAKACPDLREEEIVAIEEVGVQEVYDIQTESGEYLTNNVAVHNCFILSVEDTMDSILAWIGKEGRIFKGGSGSGINLSTLRSSRERLSAGGIASGPVSFMRGADACAGAIKSGGTTRRAAKMVILNVDHPDVVEFVRCKAEEEKKAWALGEMGYDMGLNGEAWQSIQFQNANNSVRVTDEFMFAVEAGGDWHTTAITTGEVMDTLKARELMREIAEAAWVCGDPGMQYDSTINRWHTCPASGRINASNPCFPGDARVHTSLGLVPVAELYERHRAGERFRVYTHRATGLDGRTGVASSVPLAVMENGVAPILRLRFRGGHELRCTPEHRLFTLNRGYVEARRLTADDRVMLNDSPTPADDASWSLPILVDAMAVSFARGGTATERRLPERWSEGLGELMGHLVGDGWVTDVQTGWVYGPDDVADGLAGSHEGLVREMVGGVSRQQMANGTVQLRVGSAAVRELMRGLGVTGARAPEKHVPEGIFLAPSEVQAAFLRGLFGADGCVSRVEGGKASRYVGLGSRSVRLLKGVQRLLNAFGVTARIYGPATGSGSRFTCSRADGDTVEYASAPGFDLRITGRHLEGFAAAIGFSAPRKQEALERLLGETSRYATRAYVTLEAAEEDGQEVVYNLTEPLHHSYIVDGIVVANCSEYMHLDDSACNLASLNLMSFVDGEGAFLVEDFTQAVDVLITAMDVIVSRSGYPTDEIARNARAYRQLGLGYANLGALLMSHGLPYDSDAGRAYAAAVTSLMTGRAYEMSTRLAERLGTFSGYADNARPMMGVMRMHRRAAEEIPERLVPDPRLLPAGRAAWDRAVERGEVFGYRNAQASVLAPTGTIGFMMDCDTTGVEPDIALVKYKKLVGGGVIKMVNQTVPRALETLGYPHTDVQAIVSYIDEHETIEGAPGLREEHLAVFDCAFPPMNGSRTISWKGHIMMMGAVQPFISGAISKTVNMPHEATADDIMGAYMLAWKQGVKALAIYRDGSKRTQPLSTGKAAPEPAAQAARPIRRRLPDERQAITHHFRIADHDGYITVGMYEDGGPGEVFMKMAKQGSTVSGLMDSLAICMSLALQYGVPLQTLADKLSHMRFDPSGFTGNQDIPMAKSIVDYVVRWLSSKFLSEEEKRQVGIITAGMRAELEAGGPPEGEPAPDGAAVASLPAPAPPGQTALPVGIAQAAGLSVRLDQDGQICGGCGWTMVRSGSCYKCMNCGSTSGCS